MLIDDVDRAEEEEEEEEDTTLLVDLTYNIENEVNKNVNKKLMKKMEYFGIPGQFTLNDIDTSIVQLKNQELLLDITVNLSIHRMIYEVGRENKNIVSSLIDSLYASKFIRSPDNKSFLHIKEIISKSDILFIPIHSDKHYHWSLLIYCNFNTMYCINKNKVVLSNKNEKKYQTKKWFYLDSMGQLNFNVAETLHSHLKKYRVISPSSEIEILNVPRQESGFECGYFVLQYTLLFLHTMYDITHKNNTIEEQIKKFLFYINDNTTSKKLDIFVKVIYDTLIQTKEYIINSITMKDLI